MNNKGRWIWYPGDFEIWLHERVSVRREERGRIYPPFWRVDSCYKVVTFSKKINLKQSDRITIYCDGQYYARINGWDPIIYEDIIDYTLKEGKNEISITVYNETGLPSVLVTGNELFSDESWEVTLDGKNYTMADSWKFDSSQNSPSRFKLETREIEADSTVKNAVSLLCDFGKETFGYIKLSGITGKGSVNIYYGESQQEALDTKRCEVLDRLFLKGEEFVVHNKSRALRYAYIIPEEDLSIDKVSLLYEYLPVEYKAEFKCSNENLNEIWDASLYTLHLNTREFFLDGIKRDRWVWSGDAYQSALMNYYSFMELDVTKRTFLALRGKDPVTSHINRIVDYSSYWFIGLYDYYLYTGDFDFIRKHFVRIESLMEYCLRRTNAEGLVEGDSSDWTYIDWADIDNRGEVSTEQILFARSLEIMSEFLEILGNREKARSYKKRAEGLIKKTFEIFWDDKRGLFLHNRFEGVAQPKITKYPNMFGILFNYLNSEQIETIKSEVMLSKNVQKITTPYMRFYELAALCELGEHETVLREILSYWGGMLDLGATSFWEAFDPNLSGKEHYAFYGRPYGKSLCHAWGASPIYLLGKYYLGVRPLAPGYSSYSIEPHLGGMEWIQGTVPTADGQIEIYMDKNSIKVRTSTGKGYLRFVSSIVPASSHGQLRALDKNTYEVAIDVNNVEYVISYSS